MRDLIIIRLNISQKWKHYFNFRDLNFDGLSGFGLNQGTSLVLPLSLRSRFISSVKSACSSLNRP